MTETNGWPGKPGVPLNPETDGWHWLQAKYYDDPVGPFMAFFWDAAQQTWPKIKPYGGRTFHYLGPCLTPDEETALQARVAELEGLIRAVHRNAKNLAGDRTFDQCITALMWIDDLCRAALEGEKDE